jgi:CheY-like chemotaxis protein
VEVAEDGQRGIEMALAWAPEVAIIDIGLPVLDGYQVAQQLRKALASVCLIALTAYSAHEARQRAFEAGFDHFLNKPADSSELHRLIAASE